MASAFKILDLSDTAIWVAYYRARESERPDALFRDPLAKLLAGDRGEQIARYFAPTAQQFEWAVACRTVLIDNYIQAGIAAGVDGVLNLGAGLDTRPYRMELPETLLWSEAEFSQVVEYKNRMLAPYRPRCRLERYGIDLIDANSRREILTRALAGSNRVLVVTEGVVPYLSEEQVTALAADLRSQTQVSCWVVEYLGPGVYKYLKAAASSKMMANAPFRFFPSSWVGFFERNGWKMREIHYNNEVTRRTGRMPPMSRRNYILLKTKDMGQREWGETSAGYMLLEPQRD